MGDVVSSACPSAGAVLLAAVVCLFCPDGPDAFALSAAFAEPSLVNFFFYDFPRCGDLSFCVYYCCIS